MGARLDGLDDGLVEAHQPGLLEPLVLDGLQLVAELARLLGGDHEVVERLQPRVRGAQDEGVVARVDGRRDERRRLGVGARHRDQVAAHDVGLRTDRHEPVDVLADGHEHLARHVPALLGARGLVLDVDARRALLDEELGQLHDGRQAAVARVGVGDDGPQVVDVEGALGARGLGHAQALLALFPVVEELGHEQVLDLVGHSGVGVVCQIRAGLVRRGGGR